MIVSKKTRGWQNRLIAYLTSVSREPFNFGTFDCALMTGRAIWEMTGFDPMEKIRGRYKTLPGGMKHIKAAGFTDFIDYVMQPFPALETIYDCIPGDLVALPATNWSGNTLGIVQGPYVYVPAEVGTTVVPLEMATRACRI